MKKLFNTVLFGVLFFAVLSLCVTGVAYAADAASAGSASEVFDKLAGKANTIGGGLRRVGFAIAGLGLIVFSFMAIFNKISWKNLAYIMMSCFVLSAMALVIKFARDDEGLNDAHLGFGDSYKKEVAPGDVKGVPVSK